MISYNGKGGLDTLAVGLDKRLLKLRQLPQDDVVLIRAYVENTRNFYSIRLSTYFIACRTGSRKRIFSSAWKANRSGIRRMKIFVWLSA